MKKAARIYNQFMLDRWQQLQLKIGLSDKTSNDYFRCVRHIRKHRLALVEPFKNPGNGNG